MPNSLSADTWTLSVFSDLQTLLRHRAIETSDSALIGFYDRKSRSWTTQRQALFFQRAAALSARLPVVGHEENHYVIVVSSSPESTLLGFLAAILNGSIPVIVPVRSAFDSKESVNARIEDVRRLVGANATLISEVVGDHSIISTAQFSEVLEVRAADILPLAELPVQRRPAGAISHIQLTSGSTGTHKGVAITHANVFANVESLRKRALINSDDVYVSWLPLYHDMGLISQALMPLILSIDVHLMSPFDFLADPMSWVRAMSDFRGSVTASPTFGYELIVKRAESIDLSAIDLSTWKAAYCGAEPVRAEIARSFTQRFAACGLRSEAFIPSYGLAESTLAVTSNTPTDLWRSISVSRSAIARFEVLFADDPSVDDALEVVSVGTPVEGIDVFIVDADGNSIDRELACGEVAVRGESVAAGWLSDGGTVTPFSEATLRTGDVGFFQAGELFVVERMKNIVIRNGHNYSAQILEQTLASQLSIPVDEVVIVDRDIQLGEGLTAIVEAAKGISPETYLQRLTDGLDLFEPPIEYLVVVKRGAIPRTTSGKKQHMAVREALINGSLKHLDEFEVAASVGATAGLATDLAEIESQHSIQFDHHDDEAQILRIVAEHARARGVDAPIVMASRLQYDLDFDSLELMELAMHVEEQFHVQLTREMIAEVRTVRDLMTAVQDSRPNGEKTDGGLKNALNRLKNDVPQYFTVVEDVAPNRSIKVNGRWMIDLASCGYLGLEDQPTVLEAIEAAHKKWGLQRWSTRAVGLPQPVIDLEQRIADFIGVPSAMLFPTITLLHMGVLPILAGVDGAIVIDTAAHTSMQEASALARGKGTYVTSFRHGDTGDLETRLAQLSNKARRIIVLDGVYSMSGSSLDVAKYQAIAEKYDAHLYIDDAHGFGVLGENPSEEHPFGHRGNGVVRHAGRSYDRIFYVCGLGKAFSTSMGFISCPTPEARELFHSAATVIFGHLTSTSALAQAAAVLDINDQIGDDLRSNLRRLTSRLASGATERGFIVRSEDSGVINLVVGDIDSMVIATNVLWEDGIKITPAMFPAVPLHENGLRFTVTATNTVEQIDTVLASLDRLNAMLHGSMAIAAPARLS